MQMRSFDYFADRKTDTAGMTRIATLIRTIRHQARARGDLVITLDNGDSLQGTPLDEQALADMTGPHIFYRALGLMGYDAAGLGNHDFNFELTRLVDSLRHAPLPVLCSNAHRIDGGELPVQRWTVLERTLCGTPLRIGIFSVLPPQTLIWDADHLSGRLAIDDITASAREAICALQEEGCDLVIALAHTGLGERHELTGQENALWPLSALDGLDAIIAGHTHLHLPDPKAPQGSEMARGVLNGTPVVMPGAGGAYLGVIDLDLSHADTGWQINKLRTQLRAACGAENRELGALTAPIHRATRRQLARTLGHTSVPLHSYFSFIAPSAALEIVAAAKAEALRRMHVIPEGLKLLSSAAPAKTGGRSGPQHYVDIPAGPLSLRHAFDLCYFPNRLAAVIVTGAQLADWIEMSAGIYNQITRGDQPQSLIDATRPAHGSDLFYGIDYELDLSRPSRFDHAGALIDPAHRRLVSLEYGGEPVARDDRFAVALSSYRANGGGNVAVLQDAHRLTLPGKLVRETLEEYLLAGHQPNQPDARGRRFARIGASSVLAPTGPGALSYLHELGDLCTGTDGTDAGGFVQLRLSL